MEALFRDKVKEDPVHPHRGHSHRGTHLPTLGSYVLRVLFEIFLVLGKTMLHKNLKMAWVGDLVNVEAAILVKGHVDAEFDVPFNSTNRPRCEPSNNNAGAVQRPEMLNDALELCRVEMKTMLFDGLQDGLDEIIVHAIYKYQNTREGGEWWCFDVRLWVRKDTIVEVSWCARVGIIV